VLGVSVDVLICVAVCCSVLQCVAVCCSVSQCVAVSCSVLGVSVDMPLSILLDGLVVFRCVAVYVAVRRSVLQCMLQ